LLAVGILWVYLPAFGEIFDKWTHDPRYSHGYIVPLFSAYLLWSRRKQFPADAVRTNYWGLALIAPGLLLGLFGTYTTFQWASQIAILPLLAGGVLLLGGWPVLRWAAPALAFLAFMVPLPYRVETTLSGPLQKLGTKTSVYLLQTLGYTPYSEGNVVILGEHRIGVVEACNGLSMLLIFFALATAMAMISTKPLLDRLFLLVVAAPIAVLCNLLRITVTGLLYQVAGQKWADLVFHDLAGWLMMPLALFFLWLSLKAFSWVFPMREEEGPGDMWIGTQARPPGSPAKSSRPAPATP
jgi:exosortase